MGWDTDVYYDYPITNEEAVGIMEGRLRRGPNGVEPVRRQPCHPPPSTSQQWSPPPQVAGQKHRKDSETTPQGSPTSPSNSSRTPKRSRIDADETNADIVVPDQNPNPTNTQSGPALTNVASANPIASLEHLLTAALSAALELARATSPSEPSLAVQELLIELNNTLRPPQTSISSTKETQPATTTKRTAAEVVKASPTNKSRKGHPAAPKTANATTPFTLVRKRRLIMHFPDGVPTPRGSSMVMCQNINIMLDKSKIRVCAVDWTRHGQLVITTEAPSTAEQLLGVSTMWKEPIMKYLRVTKANLTLDVPWHRVVVNGIRTVVYTEPGKAEEIPHARFQHELEQANPWLRENTVKPYIMKTRLLSKPGADRGSLLCFVADEGIASRMRLEGVFAFANHLRVSTYKSKSKQATL